MRRRFKIAFVILLVVTIVWFVALYLHLNAYREARRKGIDALLFVGPFSISAIVIVASWISLAWKHRHQSLERVSSRTKRKSRVLGVIAGVVLIIVLVGIIQSFRMFFATTETSRRLAYSLAVVTFVFIGYFAALNIAYHVFGVDLEKHRVIRRLNKILRI